jgi:hypothetical protein
MATFETSIEIARSPEEVFDFMSDLRSERSWNPAVEKIEKITDGPIGVGTRYMAKWKRSPEVIVECTHYDRPNGWTNINGGSLEIESVFTLVPTRSGTRLTNDFTVRPHGLTTLFLPVIVSTMRRQFRTNLTELKRVIEGATTAARQQ